MVPDFRAFGVGGTIGRVLGIGFGSVFLAWLYQSSSCSILTVALWHNAHNFATATKATSKFAAMVATTAVIVASVIVVRRKTAWEGPVVRRSSTEAQWRRSAPT